MDSDGEDNDFESYDRSEGKPLHVDIGNEITDENKAKLALLPNRWEQDGIKNNG